MDSKTKTDLQFEMQRCKALHDAKAVDPIARHKLACDLELARVSIADDETTAKATTILQRLRLLK